MARPFGRRIAHRKGRKEKHSGASLLTSSGFPLIVLVFHPHFQSSYEFRELAPAPLAPCDLRRLAFTHVKGSPSPSVLLLKGREYPLEWKGIAWVIPESGQVVRIEASLAPPIEDLGLLSLSAAVSYAPVSFAGGTEVLAAPDSHRRSGDPPATLAECSLVFGLSQVQCRDGNQTGGAN